MAEIGVGVARQQPAGQRGEPDAQNRRARQREGNRVSGRQRERHRQDQNGEKERFHQALSPGSGSLSRVAALDRIWLRNWASMDSA